MKRLLAALLLFGLSFAPASATTEIIRIYGYVPVICHADFFAAPHAASAVVQLGTINEFCNAGTGYQIVADYPPSIDPGTLLIDGQAVPLDRSGRAVLAVMNGPRAIAQTLAYLPGRTPITAIRIQLVPALI